MANEKFEKMEGFVEYLAREKDLTEEQKKEWWQATMKVEHEGDAISPEWPHFMALPCAWGWIAEDDLFRFLATFLQLPYVDIGDYTIQPDVLDLIPSEIATRHQVIPLARGGEEARTLYVATADPFNVYAQDDLKFLTGNTIMFHVASPTQISEALEKYYSAGAKNADDFLEYLSEVGVEGSDQDEIDIEELEETSREAPVVRLVNLVLVDAVRRDASEIHVEPYEKEFRVRYRLDGVLHEMMRPPLRLRNAIVSRIKIMANLDIVNRQTQQRGKIRLVLGRNKEVDFLVSTVPVSYGEKVVLKVLDQMKELGPAAFSLAPEEMPVLCEKLAQPGMKIIYGLAGSGKTALLNLLLGEMRDRWHSVNVTAVGDVTRGGIALPGVNCMPVNEARGLTFARALDEAVRNQSADVIVVGSLPDKESAQIAVSATLAGKIVLCEVNAGSAESARAYLRKLMDDDARLDLMQMLFIGTRLVRKLCMECRSAVCMDEKMAKVLERIEYPMLTKMFQPRGCRCCNNIGYRGLIGVCEFRENDKLRGQSHREKLCQLIEDGLTSLKEALR